MVDQYGRLVDYLRISITDRCNLQCAYCSHQSEDYYATASELLTKEEILMACRSISRLGIRKIRITGGEPFFRLDAIEIMKEIKKIPRIEHISVTTNGALLKEQLEKIKDIGLDGINISLDTLNADKYKELVKGSDLNSVLESIKVLATMEHGPVVKINCLAMREWNLDEITQMAALAKDYPISVRFIELMPLGIGEQYTPIYQDEMIQLLEKEYGTLTPFYEKLGNGPAKYYEIEGFKGKVGFISPMSHGFCEDCNRIRLTADGQLKLCLEYNSKLNVRDVIRRGTEENTLTEIIGSAIFLKPKHNTFCKRK